MEETRQKATVSVIMGVYNCEATVQAAAASILEQPVEHLELLPTKGYQLLIFQGLAQRRHRPVVACAKKARHLPIHTLIKELIGVM